MNKTIHRKVRISIRINHHSMLVIKELFINVGVDYLDFILDEMNK
jgi:hypothetical protein